MDLLYNYSYVSLLAANIAEFVDQNKICEQLICFSWFVKKALMEHITILCKGIAQIGPLSFQAAIEHKPRQVRWGGLHAPVVTEWWPACLHKQFPSVHHRGN